ncbi:uncharacterized protein BP5553_01414 [Venustampulla echinocandica]|uniref:Xylanolytic transcriptional activator regulatory domain-containing protein n=1 Tax=Venustampulla echinocandica TaxID=2656787 RepID=A0A370U0Z8_9HELO|nr:uncharacterized protein BP5553_01414 [Venustampulla echinocandica]RDL41435.1 hypothetical protein BP5553_01414 [Venustampulla echinocandica]
MWPDVLENRTSEATHTESDVLLRHLRSHRAYLAHSPPAGLNNRSASYEQATQQLQQRREINAGTSPGQTPNQLLHCSDLAELVSRGMQPSPSQNLMISEIAMLEFNNVPGHSQPAPNNHSRLTRRSQCSQNPDYANNAATNNMPDCIDFPAGVLEEAAARTPSELSLPTINESADAMRWWLDQSDFRTDNLFSMDIGNGLGAYGVVLDDVTFGLPVQFQPPVESSIGSRGMSAERCDILQECWPMDPSRGYRLKSDLWSCLSSCPHDNIFSLLPSPTANEQRGERRGFDEACYLRLRKEFGYDSGSADEPRLELPSSHRPNLPFPPVELLDIALDLYFRSFHPTVPFIHTPTFDPCRTPPPLLFAICLVGLVILGTSGARQFVEASFPALLTRACSEMAISCSQSRPVAEQLSMVATACLTVNLAAITQDQSKLARTQFLYANIYAFSQQCGLFSADDSELIKKILDETVDPGQRWRAWTRIESTKRLIVALVMLDNFYSNYLFTAPATRAEAIHICLPCDNILFEADSEIKWRQLSLAGREIIPPFISPYVQDPCLFQTANRLDTFSMYSLLSSFQLRIYEAYHRLIPAASYTGMNEDFLAPCRVFNKDLRARDLIPLTCSLHFKQSPCQNGADLNCMALWHHLCLCLTSNTRLFELAAGCKGQPDAEKARVDIGVWARTPAARRACLHAAQVYAVVSNRRISDGVRVRLDTITSVFISALVLAFYLYSLPDIGGSDSTEQRLELLDPIDWGRVGTIGLDAVDAEDPNIPLPTQQLRNGSDLAIHFIRHGGPVSFSSHNVSGDYRSARRVLLDFACLMEGMGKWCSKSSAKVLHAMADTIMQNGDGSL